MERNFERKRYGDLTPCLLMRAALDQDKLAELVVQVEETGGLDPARPLIVDVEGNVLNGNRRWLANMIRCELRAQRGTDQPEGPIRIAEAARCIEVLLEQSGGWEQLLSSLATRYSQEEAYVVVNEGSASDAMEMMRHNFGTVAPDALGIARTIQEAQRQGEAASKIGQAIGKSNEWMAGRTALLAISPDMVEAIQQGRYPLGLAKLLAKLPPVKREPLEDLLLSDDFSNKRVTLDKATEVVEFLEGWDGPQCELLYKSPREYNMGRILAALWQRSTTPWVETMAVIWRYHSGTWFWKEMAKALGPEYVEDDGYYGQKLDEARLVSDFLPGVTCKECPISQLPQKRLASDIPLPCRKSKSFEGPCTAAPGVDGAPFLVEVKWEWHGYPGVNMDREFVSLKKLQRAWEHRRDIEAKDAADTDPITAGAGGPIQKQRARTAHFIEHHTQLDCTHALATSCAACAWKLDESPTRNPDVPHCQWAGRLRHCEFFVRVPQGIGPVIPVCRQFRPAALDTPDKGAGYFRERITEFPDAASPVLTGLLRAQIPDLARDAHQHIFSYGGASQGGRTLLESFTGRPLKKTEDHSSWILSWLDDVLPALNDAGVATLWCLVRSEWEQARDGYWGKRDYHLLVGTDLVEYRDVDWSSFWLVKGETDV